MSRVMTDLHQLHTLIPSQLERAVAITLLVTTLPQVQTTNLSHSLNWL